MCVSAIPWAQSCKWRLGHSKIGITLDLYSHVMPNMQDDAAARIDEALQAAINKRPSGVR
jgi:hypothetical protein